VTLGFFDQLSHLFVRVPQIESPAAISFFHLLHQRPLVAVRIYTSLTRARFNRNGKIVDDPMPTIAAPKSLKHFALPI